MKYLCTNCNYIYDEALWDSGEWLESGVKIDDNFMCPVCEEYDTFHHVNEEICYLDDEPTDLFEIDHFIEVNHKWEEFEVIIWWNTHPMWEDHRIVWVWLFDEYSDLIDEKFLKTDDDSVVIFDDFWIDEFEIRVKCSEHKLFAKKFVL